MKTYLEKLKDPRWQRKRLEIMQRDEFSCNFCGDDSATLNVHHCYYGKNRNPWDYSNDHLITLCEACHKHVEEQKEDILKAMNWPVGIDSMHMLATQCHGRPFMAAAAITAVSDIRPERGQFSRMLKTCQEVVDFLKEKIELLQEKIEAGYDLDE